jgi:pSer/pThr/pTyr-binding forkhead associated (FHA) protein
LLNGEEQAKAAYRMIKFIVFYDNELVKTYELDDPVITIGRLPENTICISNMGISRRHAKIERDSNNSFTIGDLNSLNGTFINNTKVKKAMLADGDKITIGKYTILFEDMEKKAPSAAAAGHALKKDDTSITSPSTIEEMMPYEPPPTREQTSVVADQPASAGSAVLIEINKHVIYKLDKPLTTLGDSENDDIFVSGFLVDEGHVMIERSDNELWIRSQKLLGQFKVNGRKTKNHKLRHKDRVEIGSSTFRYMENA